MRLTKLAIATAKYEGEGGSRDVRWDDAVKGFGVRIMPSGAKSFVLSYRMRARKHLMTIGPCNVLQLNEARNKARRYLAQILEGQDPLNERQSARNSLSVRDVCQAYIERRAKPFLKSWKQTERRVNTHILPALGSISADQLRREDVVKLHLKVGQNNGHTEANRVQEIIRQIYNFAREEGTLEGVENPASKIKRFKETKRDRWVRPDEMQRLAAEINAHENVYIKSSLWLLVLTGMRKMELLETKWEDVDFGRREIRLSGERTKNRLTHLVHLNEPAIAILKNLPRERGNEHVFPGHKIGSHLSWINKAWETIRAKANLRDVTIHDLRRTVGSWLAGSGVSLLVIGRALGHLDLKSTEVYARLASDPVSEALEAHGREIVKAVGAPVWNAIAPPAALEQPSSEQHDA